MKTETSYKAFYTTRPFWVGSEPNIDEISKDKKLFRDTLSEVVEEFESDDIYLGFCRDGLIMARVKSLKSRSHISDDDYIRTSAFLKVSASPKTRKPGISVITICVDDLERSLSMGSCLESPDASPGNEL